MAYITLAELINRFGRDEITQLTDKDDRGSVNDVIANESIADAKATADSYLQSRYTLPLSQALIDASPLKRICGDIARYFLFDDEVPEVVEKNHTTAIRWLRDIQSGKATLGEQDTQAVSSGRFVTAKGKSNIDWGVY